MSFQHFIALAALTGYTLARIAEGRIHKVNYLFLKDLGAEELISQEMKSYYRLIIAFLILAVAERAFVTQGVDRAEILGGLALVIGGLVLRFWAIKSLGRLWSMRCLGLPGTVMVRTGPYRLMRHPEYISRLLDGAGLCLIIGAPWTALAYSGVAILATWRIVAVERRQLGELTGHFHEPMSHHPASSH